MRKNRIRGLSPIQDRAASQPEKWNRTVEAVKKQQCERSEILFDARAHSAGFFVWADDQLVSHPACPPPPIWWDRGAMGGVCACVCESEYVAVVGGGSVVYFIPEMD